MICLQPGIIAWNVPKQIFSSVSDIPMLFEPGFICLYFVWYFSASFDFFQDRRNIQENQFSFLQSKRKILYETQGKANG